MSGRAGNVRWVWGGGAAVAILCAVSVLPLACGSKDSCTAANGGCAEGCVANAANQCVPIGSTDGGQSTGGGTGTVSQVVNGAHISLDCRPYNIPAYTTTDCLYSHYCGEAGTVPCTMKLADRDGMVIKSATTVGFRAEAGDVSPSATSPAYDSSKALVDQEDLGHAVGFLEACDAPLPVDVDPLPNSNQPNAHELSRRVDLGCGPRTTNPRDGLVTIIAWVRGEEGYVDQNRNGKYDAGEPFIDLGEPYVDVDDSGQWQAGDWYLDVNGNGAYDGPNGKWDANTTLWTQARVVYTGQPTFASDATGNLYSRLYSVPGTTPQRDNPGAPPNATPNLLPFTLGLNLSTQVGFFFTDQHLNPLSSLAKFEVGTVTGKATAAMFGPDPLADSQGLGMNFRMRYCDRPSATGTCRDGPAEQACITSPCYVMPDVGEFIDNGLSFCEPYPCSGFSYGNRGTALLTCGEKPGPDTLMVKSVLEGVTTVMSLPGQCL